MSEEKKEKNSKSDDEDDVEYTQDEDDLNPQEVLSKVRNKLKNCVKEKQEYLEGWQRARADLINTRREFEEEKKYTVSRANEKLITDLLVVLDSFEMAFSNKKSWETVGAEWRGGVEHIHKQLLKILSEYGVEPIDSRGKMFDPKLHTSVEAVTVENEAKDGYIVDELQKGYMMGERVIRSAKVRVGEYKAKKSG